MNERIVFAREPTEFLQEMECTVVETYHFGDVGSAALVECAAEHESAIADDDRVVAVEANHEVELHIEPAHVSEDRDTVATIEDVRRLHDVPEGNATGAGLAVVAMDSGIDPNHPVFEDVAIQQVDVTGSGTGDAVGHGTAVLGQITRLAPDADLIALRIFGEEGRTKNNVIMRAYEWLHDNTDAYDVVNMSWGSQKTSRAINRTHNGLVETGVRDVVSAGNSGEKSGSPATAERAFSIAACTEEGNIAEFSSYNPDRDNPDIAAIGKDNRLAQAEGTAMGTDLDGPWVKACVPAHTQVLTAEGEWKRMFDLHRMDEPADVISYDRETGCFEQDAVLRTLKRNMDSEETLFRLTTDEGHALEATGNHEILTSGGYRPAADVSIGDDILTKPDVSAERKVPGNEGMKKRKTVECRMCGTLFDVPKYRTAKFCSLSCRYECMRTTSEYDDVVTANLPGPEEIEREKERVELQCDVCGSTYEVKPYRAETAQYCSRRCTGLSRVAGSEEDVSGYLSTWREENPAAAEELAQHPEFVAKQDETGTFADFSEERMSEVATQGGKAAVEAMRNSSHYEPTSIEIRLHEFMDTLGIDYEKEHVVYDEDFDLLTSIDVAVPERKIAVYADGEFWHSTPETKDRDRAITAKLERLGWEVVRFGGDEIRESPSSVRSRLSTAVSNGATVTSITTLSDKTVYDLTTERNHNFVANGLIVHNSGTSFSAPEVAGMVAKYLDAAGSTPPKAIMRDFEAAARNIPDQPRDGAGLADYAAAVEHSSGDER